jgi:GTP-binding protein
LTKSDKLSKIKQKNQHIAIAEALGVNNEEPIRFSAKSRMGKDDLWDAIAELIGY